MVFPKVVYFNIVFTFISCIKDCLKRNLSKLCAVSKCNQSNSMYMRLFSICDKIKSFQNFVKTIALFVVSGSIKKVFSFDCAIVYLFSVFFLIDFAQWKNVGLSHIAYIVIHLGTTRLVIGKLQVSSYKRGNLVAQKFKHIYILTKFYEKEALCKRVFRLKTYEIIYMKQLLLSLQILMIH